MRLHHRCGELFVAALLRGRRPSGERRIASASVGASGESRHPATVAVRRVPVVLSRVWREDPLTQIVQLSTAFFTSVGIGDSVIR